ncbi:hypothetical protein MJC1_04150 [Methylocystis sp. MJC1]|nr:hypothetical protein MJC1_04150 [Methylocystis sp. MJC1]
MATQSSTHVPARCLVPFFLSSTVIVVIVEISRDVLHKFPSALRS